MKVMKTRFETGRQGCISRVLGFKLIKTRQVYHVCEISFRRIYEFQKKI